jgi:hypothetical protein
MRCKVCRWFNRFRIGFYYAVLNLLDKRSDCQLFWIYFFQWCWVAMLRVAAAKAVTLDGAPPHNNRVISSTESLSCDILTDIITTIISTPHALSPFNIAEILPLLPPLYEQSRDPFTRFSAGNLQAQVNESTRMDVISECTTSHSA